MPTTTKPTLVENIQVLQVGKYGVRIDEKTWFGVNEPLTPSHFVPNEGYKVSVTVSKTGKKYINEIIGQEQKADAPAEQKAEQPHDDSVKVAEEALAKAKAMAEAKVTAAKAEAAKPASTPATTTKSTNPTRAGFGQQLTDYDLQIQRQISRAGVIQAALTSPAIAQWAVNIDEYLALVRKAADFGFKYVGE
jgi:hypothetical protein